ncbi:hypothetical protein HJC23_009038 [Cyclotella cryptica]|uniref:Uncharacterized protein n=1 Tax=Cyclotella cryptica TaxID=29204 RepID=A0ABD3R2U0_9STRA|eukprot:CCRYP_000652-RA/>CCRYP_000652-RA protein AED:0.17 eAED:0.17 QI:453/1/1/1/0/0/2/1180/937
MWSAISSYLGDTSTQPPPQPRQQQTQSAPRRAPPTPPLSSLARSPRASLLSSVMASSAEKARSDSSDNAAGTAQQVAILRGLVVGSPRSGKTSLLRRLRGEQLNRVENRRLMALLPWRMSEAVGGSGARGDARELVQLYLAEAPSFSFSGTHQTEHNQQTIHDEWNAVLHKATRRNTVDFIVWLIDSRQNVDEVLQFVNAGLECLFPPPHGHFADNEALAGSEEQSHSSQSRHNETKDDDHGDETDESPKQQPSKADESYHESSSPLVQNLCILLNFRDLQSNVKENDDNPSSLLEQIQQVVDAVLSRHRHEHQRTHPATLTSNTYNQSKHRPSVLVYESSMISNYGIQSLYSFIALPYLLYKENEYYKRMVEVQREYDRVKQELVVRSEMDSKGEGYDAFVKKNIGRKMVEDKRKVRAPPTRTSNEERNSNPHPTVVDDKKSNKTVAPGDPQDNAPPTHVESNAHRQLFPSLQQVPKVATTATSAWTPLDNSNRNNLDSFFSDEDESDVDVDESNRPSVGQPHTKGKDARGSSNNHVLDSDNDSGSSHGDSIDEDGENSDDDFFIDSAGNRHTHASPSIKVRDIDEQISSEDKQCVVEGVLSSKADPASVELEEKKEDGETSVHDAAEDDERSVKKSEVDDGSVHNEADEENDLDYTTDSGETPVNVTEAKEIEKKSLADSNNVSDVEEEQSELNVRDGEIAGHDGEQVDCESVDNDDEISSSKPSVDASTQASLETEPNEADSSGDVNADNGQDARPEHDTEEKSIHGLDPSLDSSERSAGYDASVIMDDTTTKSSVSETEQTVDHVQTSDKKSIQLMNYGVCQSQIVLDSDDESTCVPKSKVDDHEYEDSFQKNVQHMPHERELLPKHTNKAIPEAKNTPAVSNAALAAIEAARLEAERALGESNSINKEKKSKKESKKKSSKSKKSKKKDTKS